jgi:hypothetical protein
VIVLLRASYKHLVVVLPRFSSGVVPDLLHSLKLSLQEIAHGQDHHAVSNPGGLVHRNK